MEAEVNSWKKEEMTSYCSRNSLRRTTGTKAQLAELIVPAVLELDNLADRSFHLPIGTIILTGTEVGDPQVCSGWITVGYEQTLFMNILHARNVQALLLSVPVQRWTVLEVTDDSDRSLHPKEYIVW